MQRPFQNKEYHILITFLMYDIKLLHYQRVPREWIKRGKVQTRFLTQRKRTQGTEECRNGARR